MMALNITMQHSLAEFSVDQAVLELKAILPNLPSNCRDYRCESLHQFGPKSQVEENIKWRLLCYYVAFPLETMFCSHWGRGPRTAV